MFLHLLHSPFMLILGGHYGSVEEKSGKSYTHLEYEYALTGWVRNSKGNNKK